MIVLEEVQRTRKNAQASAQADPEGLSTAVERHPSGNQELSAEQQVVTAIRDEIDGYLCTLKQLGSMPPDEVMLQLSGITARLTEIRTHLFRSDSRRFTALRTREIDPLLVEADRQFRLHSRVQAVRAFEWEVSGRGQV